MQQDDQKINFIYDNKNNAVLFEKLKETDFYKSNKDVIEETLKVGFEQMKKINSVLEKYKNFDKENGLLYIDSLCEDGSYKDILQYILSKLKLDLARNNGVRDFEYPSTCMSSNPGSIHQIADNLRRAKIKQVQGVKPEVQGVKHSFVQERIAQFEGEQKTDESLHDMPSLEPENPYNVADITHFGNDPRKFKYFNFSRFKKLTKRLLKKH
jgi:hypothetical protein